MTHTELLAVLERMLEVSPYAVLATAGADAQPRARWMAPGTVRGRPGFLYCFTGAGFRKVEELSANDRVEWLCTSPDHSEVLQVEGRMVVLDNPALKAEVQEAIGARLATFWSLEEDPGDVVVLETVITRIRYSRPSEGHREEVLIDG